MNCCDQHPDLYKKVNEIHSALISDVDGKPGLVERVRILEALKSRLTRWSSFVIGVGITGILAFVGNIISEWLKR